MAKPTIFANGLSLRANKCLALADIPADRDAVIHALQTGVLYPFRTPRNYGKKAHDEVCRWAGLDPQTLDTVADPRYATCPYCHKPLTPAHLAWRNAENQANQPAPLHWQKERPTRPGLYWHRNGPDQPRHLAWVDTREGMMAANFLEGTGTLRPPCEWAGPITVPEPE